MKVFWCWQSDTDPKVCRYFIKGALEAAIKELATELDLDEAERPELDHDTKNAAGMPDIVASIFSKIAAASAVVVDITTVARTRKKKALANPNVPIELGYAEKAVGGNRIVAVANSHWFKGPKDLPFDLRNRRGPITFFLPPDSSNEMLSATKRQLVADLKVALKLILGDVPATPETPRREPRPGNAAIWFQKGARLRHRAFEGDGPEQVVIPVEAPRAYVRVRPRGWKQPPTRAFLGRSTTAHKLWPSSTTPNGDGGLNAEGLLLYFFREQPGVGRVAFSATQFFLDDGELWTFCGKIGADDENDQRLALGTVSSVWRDAVTRSINFLTELDALSPLEVEIGVTGIEKLLWPQRFTRTQASTNSMLHRRVSSKWSADDQKKFLADSEIKLADVYGVPPEALLKP